MKAYVITTGAVFGLLTVAHLLRIVAEPHFAKTHFTFSSLLLRQRYVYGHGVCYGARPDERRH